MSSAIWEECVIALVIVATHGELAGSLIRTAELLLGRQEAAEEVSLGEGESLDSFETRLSVLLASHGNPEALVLVDLFGGTPFNRVARISMSNPGIQCVTGVNLPMLVEVLAEAPHRSMEELAEIAAESGISGIVDLRRRK